jgi:hypothetical protein
VLALISIAVMNSSTDLSAFPGLALTSLVKSLRRSFWLCALPVTFDNFHPFASADTLARE